VAISLLVALGFLLHLFGKRAPGDKWHRFAQAGFGCTGWTLLVIQPTVSKHWRKHEALTSTSVLASSFLPVERGPVVGFCSQPHYCSSLCYPTAGFQSRSSYMVSAELFPHKWGLVQITFLRLWPASDHEPHCWHTCLLAKFEGWLNPLHKADDDTVIWLQSTVTAELMKWKSFLPPPLNSNASIEMSRTVDIIKLCVVFTMSLQSWNCLSCCQSSLGAFTLLVGWREQHLALKDLFSSGSGEEEDRGEPADPGSCGKLPFKYRWWTGGAVSEVLAVCLR